MNLRGILSELRRRRVLRVVGAYLVAAFVVLQVADLVVEPLGLPAWVMTLVVVLTGLGLPVAAALAWAFDVTPEGVRRVSSGDDGSPGDRRPAPALRGSGSAAGSPSSGWLRGALVLGVVAVGLAGWAALRAPAEAPVDEGLVAVLPARVAGADPSVAYLREGVVDLVGAKLGGDAGLRAVDSRTFLRAWREAGGDEREDLAPDRALSLARGLGAGRVLVPEAVGPPNRLTISATLLSVTGEELGREEVVGTVDSLDAVVGDLVVRVLALEAGEARHRVPSLTRSLPALQAYLRGRVHYRAGRHDEAVRAYHEALQADSTFALAALSFSETVGWTLVLREYSPTARRLAWTYRDHLSARDREYLQALVGPGYPNGDGTYREWVAMVDRALRMAPDRPELWNRYGDVLIHYGVAAGEPDALERARRALRRAVELDPLYAGPTEHLVDLAAAAGDTAELRRVATTYFETLPAEDHDSEVAVEIRWMLHLALGDPPPSPPDSLGLDQGSAPVLLTLYFKTLLAGLDPALIRGALERYDAGPGAGEAPALGLRVLLALVEGRPDHAGSLLAEMDRPSRVLYHSHLFADRLANAAGLERPRAAAARLEAELAEATALEGPARDSDPFILLAGRCALGQWQALGGAPDRVPETVAGIHRLIDRLPGNGQGAARACVATIEAARAVATGEARAAESVARAESLVAAGPLGAHRLGSSLNLVLARLHENLGDRRAALAAIRRAEAPYSLPIGLAAKLREEGRLAALLGEEDAAVAAYRRYLALRPDPEPAEAAADAEVRRALERLLREG